MHEHQKKISAGGVLVLALTILNAVVLEKALVSDPGWYRYAWVTVPLLVILLILTRTKYL